MRKFLTGLILIPLGVFFIVFAFANRRLVTVTFDPFGGDDPHTGITLPLFILIIGVAIFGVVAGSVATWLGQRRWRYAARQYESDAREAHVELADLRSRYESREVSQLPDLTRRAG
ncbi:LapA family protein [Nitrobacter sp.]|uniref:LapA family protein n=1 Tax=unclassified Nitrobacter TaxID=2620411 RepID=UPI002C3F8A5B|nr:LapA family protein [Nitrobacter sp.]